MKTEMTCTAENVFKTNACVHRLHLICMDHAQNWSPAMPFIRNYECQIIKAVEPVIYLSTR